MPTHTRTYTAAEQAETVARHRSLADTVTVAEIDPFGPSVTLTAVDDADALATARRLILDRWRIEGERMAAAFGYDSLAQAADTLTAEERELCEQIGL